MKEGGRFFVGDDVFYVLFDCALCAFFFGEFLSFSMRFYVSMPM